MERACSSRDAPSGTSAVTRLIDLPGFGRLLRTTLSNRRREPGRSGRASRSSHSPSRPGHCRLRLRCPAAFSLVGNTTLGSTPCGRMPRSSSPRFPDRAVGLERSASLPGLCLLANRSAGAADCSAVNRNPLEIAASIHRHGATREKSTHSRSGSGTSVRRLVRSWVAGAVASYGSSCRRRSPRPSGRMRSSPGRGCLPIRRGRMTSWRSSTLG